VKRSLSPKPFILSSTHTVKRGNASAETECLRGLAQIERVTLQPSKTFYASTLAQDPNAPPRSHGGPARIDSNPQLTSPKPNMKFSPFVPMALSVLASLSFIPGTVAASQSSGIPEGWFPWPYQDPIPGSALDSSGLNHKPAGSKGQVLVRDGVFVTTADGERIRFWGCNLSASEAFPADEETARRVARRLAAGGINIARLHHLDAPWSVDSGGSLWTPGSLDRINIDPKQLDKLHLLVAALKDEGIYLNVNLKVSRLHTVEDGFPASIAQLPQFHKRVDYYSARHVELQKDFARQLLSAHNPHTGFSLAEDPALAVVEINNENSLLGMRTRDIGAGLHLLPEPFRSELEGLWNQWLQRNYPSRDALSQYWASDASAIGENPLTPASRWFPDAQPGNEVRITSEDPSAVTISVLPGDGVRWRSAAYLDRLSLLNNTTYTLRFRARADANRAAEVTISRDDPLWRTDKWRSRGLRSGLALTPEWQEFHLVFVTHSVVDVPSRLSFIAGHQTGTIEVRDLELVSGSTGAGLQQHQDPALANVPIPTDATPSQWNDWLQFLVETEESYVAAMRSCLIDDLGVQAPIVCTQANYGGIAGLVREKSSDFIDTHSYWQHPDFGGASGAWDMENYTINNTPQLGELGPRWFGEFGALAQLRVKGKPFTVTELDHPAPSDYAAEFYPFSATFAALQDWDGLYTFDMVGIGLAPGTHDGSILTFFDQHHHPAKWSFGPFATRLFRNGLLPPLSPERELRVGSPFWSEANHLDVLWLKLRSSQEIGFLSHRLSVNEVLLPGAAPSHIVERPGSSELPSSLARMHPARRGPVYVVEAPAAATIVGYFGDDHVATKNLVLACSSFGLNFGAVTAIALDEQPLPVSDRILITLAARAENRGAVWNAARTSTGGMWGKGGAPIAERIPATIKLRTDRPLQVHALGEDGSRVAIIPASLADGWLQFETMQGPATMHYELLAW
jgi:hypothetical protein